MTPEEVVNEINTLKNELEQANNRIAILENEPKIEKGGIDLLTGNVEKDFMQNLNSDRILETTWNDFIYTIPSTADFVRFYYSNSGTATAGYDSGGIGLSTGATSGSFADLSLRFDSSVITRTRETRFKAVAKVDSSTAIDAQVATLGDNLTNCVGFRFQNGDLKGFAANNTPTVTSVTLVSSYSTNTYYKLELFYYPSTGVKFFVDDVEKGVISGGENLPSGTTNISMLEGYIINSAAADKNLVISLAEFAQRRK